MTYVPSIWDSNWILPDRAGNTFKGAGAARKGLRGHTQGAASRVLRDGIILRAGTVERELDRHRIAAMIVRAMGVVLNETVDPRDARAVIGCIKWISKAHLTKKQRVTKDYRAVIGPVSLAVLVKYGRKKDNDADTLHGDGTER